MGGCDRKAAGKRRVKVRLKILFLIFFFLTLWPLNGNVNSDVNYILKYTANWQSYIKVNEDFSTSRRMKIFVEDFVMLYHDLFEKCKFEKFTQCKKFWEDYFVDHNIFNEIGRAHV